MTDWHVWRGRFVVGLVERFETVPSCTVSDRTAYYAYRQMASPNRLPLVLVHGAGGTHQHWLYQVRGINNASIYALDLPGHGRSEGSGQDSIGTYAQWLISFLDAVGLHQAVLVGHSMGGAIALAAALRYPDRVGGLGLIATGARLPVAPNLLEGLEQDPEAAVRIICKWAFGPQAPDEMKRLGMQQMRATPPEVLYRDFVACDAFDVRERLEEIACPTLVLCGSQDRMTPPKYSALLRDRIVGSTLELVSGSGHMVMTENPQSVIQALSTFLEELQRPGSS